MVTSNVSSLAAHAQFPNNPDTMRVSTKAKGQEVENQLAQLREFAGRNAWTMVAEYIDHESGKGSNREQFQQIFIGPASGSSTCCCSGRSIV